MYTIKAIKGAVNTIICIPPVNLSFYFNILLFVIPDLNIDNVVFLMPIFLS